MVKVIGFQNYIKLQKSRIAKLKKAKRRGPITAAKYMVAQLRIRCPRGEQVHPTYPRMYQTIRRSKNTVFMSGVNRKNGYPYIHWVNATPGVDLTSRGKLYSQVNHRAEPGFYWVAQGKTRKFGRGAIITATRNVFKSQF